MKYQKVYKRTRPENGRLAKAHGLRKIQKDFVHILKFCPIMDVASIWVLEQYLSKIFQPLTVYDYNMKDSSDVVNRIKNIPPDPSDVFYFH